MNAGAAARNYASRHWRGEYPLAISFWINFVALGAGTHLLHRGILQRIDPDSWTYLAAAVTGFVLLRLVLFPWQAIGLLRCCERALADHRDAVWVRVAQSAALLGIIVAFVDAIAVVQSGYRIVHGHRPAAAEAPPAYSLAYLPDPRLIQISGEIGPGITRAIAGLLEAHPDAAGIVLDSEGGHIYEARGIARLAREHRLDTLSLSGCYSACTTAFLGGHRRRLGPAARLGFHRYRLQRMGNHPSVDPEGELIKDFESFRDHGIDIEALRPALSIPADSMWVPATDILLRANAVHDILTPADLASLNLPR